MVIDLQLDQVKNENLGISRVSYSRFRIKNKSPKERAELIELLYHPFLKDKVEIKKKKKNKKGYLIYIIQLNNSDFFILDTRKRNTIEIHDLKNRFRINTLSTTEAFYFVDGLIKSIKPNQITIKILEECKPSCKRVKRLYLNYLKKSQLLLIAKEERALGFIKTTVSRLNKNELIELLLKTPRLKKSKLDDLVNIAQIKKDKRCGTRPRGKPFSEYTKPSYVPKKEFEYLTEKTPPIKKRKLLFIDSKLNKYNNGITRLTKTYFRYIGSTFDYQKAEQFKNLNKEKYYLRIRKRKAKNYQDRKLVFHIYLRKKEPHP